MNKFLIFAFLVVVPTFVASLALTKSPFGIVNGSESCGGSSTFINMELTGCTQAPCEISVETNYEIAMNFLSAESTASVNWMLWLYRPNGGVSRIADKMTSGVVDGSVYRASDNFTLESRFAGVDGELSILLMNSETDSRIMCGIFPVKIAPLNMTVTN